MQNLRRMLVRIETLEAQVKDKDAKYVRTVEGKARTEEDLCVRVASLESSLKMERDCIAQTEKDRTNQVAEDKDVFAGQLEADDAIKYQLKDKEETLRDLRTEPTAVSSESKDPCPRAKEVVEELLVAQASVELQTTLREERCKQLDPIVAELKKEQSHSEMREDE